MALFIIPILALAAIAAGVTLILRRRRNRWNLWIGIALVALFLLTLPLSAPFALLAILLVTGGSFS